MILYFRISDSQSAHLFTRMVASCLPWQTAMSSRRLGPAAVTVSVTTIVTVPPGTTATLQMVVRWMRSTQLYIQLQKHTRSALKSALITTQGTTSTTITATAATTVALPTRLVWRDKILISSLSEIVPEGPPCMPLTARILDNRPLELTASSTLYPTLPPQPSTPPIPVSNNPLEIEIVPRSAAAHWEHLDHDPMKISLPRWRKNKNSGIYWVRIELQLSHDW